MAFSSSSDESPVSRALRNKLILQEIFSFIPLKSLLTLSEVNKLWNAEARTYIRDHRKCTVSISSSTILPCRQLQELGQDLAGMAIVPFNSLKINLEPHAEPRPGTSHPSCDQKYLPQDFNNWNYENLISKLKLKYLLVSWNGEVVTCPATFLIFRLLTEKSNELKMLSFEEMSSPCVQLFSATDRLEFPRVKELEILDVSGWIDLDCRNNGLLKKILDGAPELEKITHNGWSNILEILPESSYKLLTKFELSCFDQEDLMRKLVESRPRISHLLIDCIEEVEDFPVTCPNPLFPPLLQSCSSVLKNLEIYCANAIEKILMIPHALPNVTHLSLVLDPEQPFEFIPELQQVQFQQLFPKLEEVELDVREAGIVAALSQLQVDKEWSNFVPDSRFTSVSTKKLCTTMEICSGGLLQLMKIFPNLEHLRAAGNRSSLALPYKDIFRFWPNLKTLVTRGHVRFDQMLQIQSCDADFCGIFQQELQVLRNMGKEELEKLQIVPVRPCVSTMKNLERLSVNFSLGNYERPHHDHQHDGNWISDPGSRFLSPVTKILVLKRMQCLNFSLKFRNPPTQ